MSDTALASQAVIEDAGPCRKKITLTVPAERVDEAIQGSYDTVADEAALPGFRKGRVPRKLIERRFGDAVRNEAKTQLISGAYTEAMEEHKLEVVGEPEGNEELEKLTVEPGKDMIFYVEVEVAPEFDTPSYDNLAIKKPLVEVTTEHVDKQLERILTNEGSLEEVEEATAGNYCIGHGKLTHNDDVVLDLPGAVIRIPEEADNGAGMILGINVEDLATQAGTPKPGDTVTVNTKGPEQHENEAIRGEDVTITFEVQSTYKIIPAEASALVEQLGLPDENTLRERIELQLNQRASVMQQSAMRQQVAKHLLDAVSFDLPGKLTAGQAERTFNRRRMELMHRGVEPAKIEENVAQLRSASGEVAARELKLFFILSRIATELEIGVSEDEIRGRIAQIAAEQRVAPAEVVKQLQQNNQIGMVAQQIREHKAVDAILAKAQVEELSADDYNASVSGDDELETIDPAGE